MELTGERMLPSTSDEFTYWEHVERYRFAISFVAGKRVLDIACGEGYGSAALLRGGASSVIGVDISPETVEHAKSVYKIDARVGSALDIPIPDASVDVVVSFETIEHIPNPTVFLDQCLRVLVPGGTLVISTPNRDLYRSIEPNNPFHCSELTVEEFQAALEARFKSVELFGQRVLAGRFQFQKGFGRLLLRLAQKTLTPSRFSALSPAARANVVQQCQERSSWLSRQLSNETVRRVDPRYLPKACYVVATASKAM